MKHTQLLNDISELALPVIGSDPIYLLDIEIKGSSPNLVIWLLVDSIKGSVSIDECARISREINFLIESKQLITGKFTLNVSSPGLDRPLSDIRQYHSNEGRLVKVKYKNNDDELEVRGVLKKVNDSSIVVVTDKNVEERIDVEQIRETKVVPIIK